MLAMTDRPRARTSSPLLATANTLAILVPGALLAGALGSQYLGGLYPCEMCHWQRWPHYAALATALLALVVKPLQLPLVVVAALLIAASGAIGVFHAGVEYHWWEGITACTGPVASGGDVAATLDSIMNAPLIRCDVAQWSFLGISLAGYNALFSFAGAIAILGLVTRRAP